MTKPNKAQCSSLAAWGTVFILPRNAKFGTTTLLDALAQRICWNTGYQ